jgi:transcriptional regulator with XRE-family HTH domain
MAETHWTEDSVDDFVHRLSFDFITQLAKRLKSGRFSRAKLAATLGVSKGRISQILNNPSNLTLKRAVAYARALGMKVSVVAYDDHDPDNHNGPVSSEIFSICWEKAGSPSDFQTAQNLSSLTDTATTNDNVILPERKGFIVATRSAKSGNQRSVYLDTNVVLQMTGDMQAATNERQRRALAVGE